MEAIKTAISLYPSIGALARALGVTTQAVCFWRDGLRQIPPEMCIRMEKLTKGQVQCEMLRPDVDWAFIRASKKRVAAQSAAPIQPIAQV